MPLPGVETVMRDVKSRAKTEPTASMWLPMKAVNSTSKVTRGKRWP